MLRRLRGARREEGEGGEGLERALRLVKKGLKSSKKLTLCSLDINFEFKIMFWLNF